ncbi:MAG: glycoside hydrolase family 2 TIM barrel-domain containing protein [Bacteroidales bacterium]
MKNIRFLFACLVSLNTFSQTVLFDNSWRFHRGGAQGAEKMNFNDSSWREIDLPHDWSIEDLPGTSSPFDSNAISQVSGGFTTGGSGWYRKTFALPDSLKNKRIIIQFDGVYMNADCWLNGEFIGNHPYGYTTFLYDVSSKLKLNTKNVLAVQVKNEGTNSRWYTGSGIYRHVWLTILDPVHIEPFGVNITTPEVNSEKSLVRIITTICNKSEHSSEIRLVTKILNPDSKVVGTTDLVFQLDSAQSKDTEQKINVPEPDLWSVDSPVLYKAVTEIYSGGKLCDRKVTNFGIRSISFSIDKGFQLNGKTVKLKGGCVHHDNGPLGAKAYDRAEERRIELLKASGFNAIRCAHNPPSPAFLDACDRLGMLVIDEAFDMWRIANNPYDYHLYFNEWWKKDIESMVYRDRNHPSVILWSIGNEIRGMESPEIIATSKMLGDLVHSLDPTRPVTAAVNELRPGKDQFFATLDIAGYNYASGGDHNLGSIYPIDHARLPDRIMLGTESYPLEAFRSWMDVTDNTYLVGDFVWTAFDYIGEASIGWRGYWQESNFFPWNLAYCGDINICGWKRPQSYYRDVLWKENQISVFVKPPSPSFPLNPNRQSWSKWHWQDVVAHWNWKGYENKLFEVTVYSSCDTAELLLNGKSLGKKKTDRSTQFIARWDVPYTPGELKVVGYNNGKELAQSAINTSGKTSSIRLTADRTLIQANNQDLSYITIELMDDKGIRNPSEERLLKFSIEGEGSIVAVGNGNPMSLESYTIPQRKAWEGRCLVIVKSTNKPGEIRLKVNAEGLTEREIKINSK